MNPPVVLPNITISDVAKLDLRIATILEAKPKEGTEKLMILRVSLGEKERQIVAGIKQAYSPESLVGKQIVVIANLEPRPLRGELSEGMLLAASDSQGNLALLTTDKPIEAGSQVR